MATNEVVPWLSTFKVGIELIELKTVQENDALMPSLPGAKNPARDCVRMSLSSNLLS
jgi:hypothetical protein